MRRSIALLCCLLLSACHEFIWRTDTAYAFHRVYLDIPATDPLYAPLRRLLIMRANALLVDQAALADLVLKKRQTSERTLPNLINFHGFVTQNTLVYTVSLAVLDAQGQPLLPYPIHIELSHTQSYSPTSMLSYQNEETWRWEDLYERAAERCLLILRFLPITHHHDTVH